MGWYPSLTSLSLKTLKDLVFRTAHPIVLKTKKQQQQQKNDPGFSNQLCMYIQVFNV